MRFVVSLVFLLLASVAGRALAQEVGDCSLNFVYDPRQFGPFDYRTASHADKFIVERRHFTRDVENLVKGETGWLGGDIAYTLRVFPNHARALSSMSKLARREKTRRPRGSDFTVECWFLRAVTYKPDDPLVRLVYGIELLRDGKKKDAIEQLEIAQSLAANDANVQYNLGLAYFDLGDFDKSLKHAHEAYRLGFPLPGLRDKLKRAGKWQDPASEKSAP